LNVPSSRRDQSTFHWLIQFAYAPAALISGAITCSVAQS